VTFYIQPEIVRTSDLSKKTSTTVVSSWGFSGYITVLPKEGKAADQTREKEATEEKSESRAQAESKR
jgi:uncharacterized protein (DUF427 family)